VGAVGGFGVTRRSLDIQCRILPPIRGSSGKDVACQCFRRFLVENVQCCVTRTTREKGEDDLKLIPVCNFEMSRAARAKTSLGANVGAQCQ
jgi:hypothetical protein